MPLLLLLFLLLPALSHAEPVPPATPLRFAACVIKVENRLLQVQDRLSGRYALPGGYIEAGETPEQAALRELYEETGLHASAVQRLVPDYVGGAFFACQTQSPLRWISASGDVDILAAPHLGREIIRARLLDPEQLPEDSRQRFSDQLPRLQPELAHIAISQAEDVTDFRDHAHDWQRWELYWLERWHGWSGHWPGWIFSNLFGSLPFWLCCVPLWRWRFGNEGARQMLTGGAVLLFLVELAKAAFAQPRPFHFIPELAGQFPAGYGMPSGHTAQALFFCLLLGQQAKWPMYWRGLFAAAATLTVAMGRTASGAHFFSDTLAGMALALSALTLLPRIQNRNRPATCWLLASLVGAAAWHYQSQPLLCLFGACCGGALAGILPKKSARQRMSCPPAWITTGSALLIILSCLVLQHLLAKVGLGSVTLLACQTLLWSGLAGYLWWSVSGGAKPAHRA